MIDIEQIIKLDGLMEQSQKTTMVSGKNLQELAERGLIDEPALRSGLGFLNHYPDQSAWRRMLNWLLLALGAALLTAGIFFFFAYNWTVLGRFAKFGLLQALLLGGVTVAYLAKLETLPGKIALVFASFMVGILIAVTGQVYQVKADSYTLFLVWLVLIMGWTWISKFTPQWILAYALSNITILAFFAEKTVDQQFMPIILFITALNLGWIALWEWGNQQGLGWLKIRWTPRLILLVLFITLVSQVNMVISEAFEGWVIPEAGWHWFWQALFWAFPLVFIGAIVYVLQTYKNKIQDLFFLAVASFSLVFVLTNLLIQTFSKWSDFEGFAFLFIGLAIVLQSGFVVNRLRSIAKTWEVQNGE